MLIIFLWVALWSGICEAREVHYLFVGSYNQDKSQPGIYVYSFDTLTGNLQKVSEVKNVLNPGYLVVSPDGRFVYACTEAHTPNAGTVSSYGFDPVKGTLSQISYQKSGGENPVFVSVHKSGRWLVNANYTEGSVSVYPLTKDGNISPHCQLITYSEGSVNKERQDRAHVHSAVFSPGQDYIFFPDLGADKIRCYAFDTLKAEPLQPAELPYTTTMPGSGPRHFTFHPNGRFAYCIEEMAGQVTAYKYESGHLDSIQRIAAHRKKSRKVFSSADIHISPDGRFLYASNRGRENNIAIFSIDTVSGLLTSIGYQSTLGDHPRNFLIDPSGKFLLVANQISGDAVVFRRNGETGMLERTGIRVDIPGASCLQIREYVIP